jgi:hypothetical protein
MYSFYLNIGSWTTPVIGSGYILAHPFYSKCQLVKAKDGESQRYKNELKGGLIFHDNEAIKLKSLSANALYCGLKVVYNSSDIWEGELQLIGKYNSQSDICELEAIESETLYSKIKANLSMKWPQTGMDATGNSWSLEFTSWSDHLGQGFLDGVTGFVNVEPDDYSESTEGITDIAAWDNAKAYLPAQIYEHPDDDTVDYYMGSFEFCFASILTARYVCIQANTNKNPSTEPTYWKLLDNAGFTSYRQERSDFDTDPTSFQWDEVNKYWYKASIVTDDYTRQMNKSYRLYSILYDILHRIDISIEIYETTSGLNTGFIPYLEAIHSGTNGCYLMYHFFSNNEKPIEDITFQDILDFMKVMFNMDWKLEGNIFIFRYESERPSTVGSDPEYDLTDCFNNDWTIWDEDSKIEDKIYKETFKIGTSQDQEFEVQEIVYDNKFDQNKDFTSNFETDIKTFLVGNSGKCIVMCYKDGSIYYLKNANGFLSGVSEYNGYLSIANCFNSHLRVGRPFAKGTLQSNSTEYSFTKKKNTVLQLKAPYFIHDDLDIENYLIHTNNGDLEVEEFNIKLSDGIAELKAVK